MGKWTPDYYDDVLHHRLKSIVSASIRRTVLEKTETEPTITYESFVEDLDMGDSFTNTLIDILVKEMADRRHRPAVTESDKRKLSERTARSLRALPSDCQIYRQRRSRLVVPDASLSPNDESVVELMDDEFEGFIDANGGMEGVQANPIHEAYTNDGWTDEWSAALLRASSPDPLGLDRDSPLPDLPRSSSIPPPPHLRRNLASHAHSLARQASIRRPARSRTVDFNDFTSRQRSSHREFSINRDPYRDTIIFSEANEQDRELSRAASSSSASTRRFFPLGAGPRRHRGEHLSELFNEDDDVRASIPSPWAFASSRQSSADRDPSAERSLGPRLRRGGLRAPESMLSRHASPAPPALPSPISMADTPVAENGAVAETEPGAVAETEPQNV